MNLNEFALITNIRSRNKALKVIILQNGVSTAAERKRKSSSDPRSATRSSEQWYSQSSNNNTITVTSNATITTVEDCGIIVAITEGRGEAACEVGIAAMNVQHPELSLFQISDTSSYIKVLNKIHILNPVEILVPITFSNSRLVDSIKNFFPMVKIVAIDRYAFRKDSGLQFVKDVCANAYNSVFLILQHKYYPLSATGALRLYLESYKRKFYAKESIKVTYNESDYNTMIDVFIADKLELVACGLGNGCEANLRKNSSLRGILNHCITKLGSRMLRSTILQPPNQLGEILSRLDCVEELYKCPEKNIAIRDSLKKLANIGQVLSLGTILKANGQYGDERPLNYILVLNSLFDEMEPLKELLSTCRANFFHEILETLNREEFQQLNTCFKNIIHEDARPASGQNARVSRVFAIKGGHSEIMDFLRKKYSDRVEEMRNYVKEMACEVGYDLQLANNQKKGYHMVMQLAAKQRHKFKKTSLPPDFCQVDIMATMVTMKTIKLLTFSNHLDDTATEIINISNIFLHKLLLEVQKHISILYLICEQIAKLDLLQSFAHATESGNRYVRPKFDNFTKVIDGRHPLLDYILDKEPVANNIIATPENRLHLITGPNGSGKSIYIRQIVLLQIMAQIGCFVPATSATFKICDRILARIYFEDNVECGASAFTLEMKEIKYFFNVVTDKTLIIIDELCRSTAVREGTALAMSICEHLMRSPAIIYFTTHYTYITKLQQMYPHIRCWQMETNELYHNGRKPKLQYKYKLIPGVVTLEAYGLALARFVWPDDITTDCEQILAKINDKSLETSIDKKMALKINFEYALAELKSVNKCTKTTAFQMWTEYKESLEKLGLIIDFEDRNIKVQEKPVVQVVEQLVPETVNKIQMKNANSTQFDNVEMTLAGEDYHAEIVTSESNKINQNSQVPSNLNNSSTTDFTENSYLLLKENFDKCVDKEIVNDSRLSSASKTKCSPPATHIKVLQNITVAKGNINLTPKIPPKGGLLFRSYSGLASQEKHILHDQDDHLSMAISQSRRVEKGIGAFDQSPTSSQSNANQAFQMFSQQMRDIMEHTSVGNKDFEDDINNKSQPGPNYFENLTGPPMQSKWMFNDEADNIIENEYQNDNIFGMQNYFSNKEALDINLDFSFGDDSNKSPKNVDLFHDMEQQGEEESGAQNDVFLNYPKPMANLEHSYDITEHGTENDTLNISTVVTEREDASFVPIENNQSTASITSSRFINGLRVENASTPLPDMRLSDIESRLKFAQKSLATSGTELNSSSNEQMPTSLMQNILSPCASSPNTSNKMPRNHLPSSLEVEENVENAQSSTYKEPQFQINESMDVVDLCGTGIPDMSFRGNFSCIGAKPKKGQSPGNKRLNELTKRDLDEFYQQKRINAMQSSNPEDIQKYYHELMNRPTMRQLKGAEVVVSARRMSDGHCVFDAPKKLKRFQAPFKSHASFGRDKHVDITMFSDKNAKVFNEYMEHKRSSNGSDSLSFEDFKRNYYNNE